MRTVIRWLMNNVILILFEEWRKARIDMQGRQAIHEIRMICDTEVRIFRAALTDLEQLQKEAARAIARFPSSEKLISEMLQERMKQIVHSINEAEVTTFFAPKFPARPIRPTDEISNAKEIEVRLRS